MCIFCDIVEGKIPSYKLYEDEYVIVILDISQVTKGHSLVIVKQHANNIFDCEDAALSDAILVTKQVGKHLMDSLQCKGMNVLTNINEAAGQTIEHLHFHLIPRYNNKDSCIITFNKSDAQDLQLLHTQLQIQ